MTTRSMCPTCNTPAIASCLCIIKEKECVNKHRWQFCSVHDRYILKQIGMYHGQITPNRTVGCICPPKITDSNSAIFLTVKTYEQMPIPLMEVEKTCSKCVKKLYSSDNFCIQCGSKVYNFQ